MPVQSAMNGNPSEKRYLKVAVVGGGLVGSLCACLLAKRGYDVYLYEYRSDIRRTELVQGRSINLSMSTRARNALKEIGLEKYLVENHGIPMKGRMIHGVNGSTHEIPYDAVNNQCIYSVGRKHLNEVLLRAAEKYPNVHTFFNHKLVSADFKTGVMTFLRTETKDIITEKADFIIGADGAYSSVRKEMMKQPMFDFSQKYIEHGYLELCIPPTNDGAFAMEKNYLHIWPRGTFMMIALPNQDCTWTVTLFMPIKDFKKLTNAKELLSFFKTFFPDAIPLIGESRLEKDFFVTGPSHLVSVKCNPYHIGGKVLILGDAAHAMVPFFGQGMNAGFEDCSILNRLMTKFDDNLEVAFSEFSRIRNPDAEAICDLAMYNYVEMRDLVNRKSFLIRKKLDTILYKYFPKQWVPLYNSVTFSEIRYSQCVQNKRFQDKVIKRSVMVVGTAILSIVLFYFLCYWEILFKM